MIGNTAVADLDLDVGSDNVFENGTNTYYLIEANDPAAVLALVGTNIATGVDTTSIDTLGTILDLVGSADGSIIGGTDTCVRRRGDRRSGR